MLFNTAYRLQNEKELTVGFFGGSITEGAGASSWNDTSWRALVMKYLSETYKNIKFTEINAAVGGTGTDLGVYRMEHDLLSKKPNLVFIEFATNDMDMAYPDQLGYYESCIRRILENDPTTDIVCVFTATKSTEDRLLETGEYRSRTAETVIAYHYGLDIVDIGEHLRRAVSTDGGNWGKYTTDCTHPNDDGYLVCFEAVKNAFCRLVGEAKSELISKKLPSPYVGYDNLVYGKMIDAREVILENSGWKYIDSPFKWRFPHYITSCGIGSELELEFDGSAFGIYWIMDKDSGMAEVTLDGKRTAVVSAFDHYCKRFSRGGYVFPFDDIESGHHTVRIRVSERKDNESIGNKIAIYSFLIS